MYLNESNSQIRIVLMNYAIYLLNKGVHRECGINSGCTT